MMNPKVSRICELIEEEIMIVDRLKKLSLNFKEIVIHRRLSALDENNKAKKTTLMTMMPVQRAKDSLISKLAVELGLHEDANVKEILESSALNEDSHKALSHKYHLLEEEIENLNEINSLVSIMLMNSYKLLRVLINIFNVHGTTDSVYSHDVKVKVSRKNVKINKKI
jgi:hypothetical protein